MQEKSIKLFLHQPLLLKVVFKRNVSRERFECPLATHFLSYLTINQTPTAIAIIAQTLKNITVPFSPSIFTNACIFCISHIIFGFFTDIKITNAPYRIATSPKICSPVKISPPFLMLVVFAFPHLFFYMRTFFLKALSTIISNNSPDINVMVPENQKSNFCSPAI